MKNVEFGLCSPACGFPIASARFFTFHFSLFTKEENVTPILHSTFYILNFFIESF